MLYSLRALLIQEDAKRGLKLMDNLQSLRALLIQEDAKPGMREYEHCKRLRALLIQEDAKHGSVGKFADTGLRAVQFRFESLVNL